jgi:magnesium transporter
MNTQKLLKNINLGKLFPRSSDGVGASPGTISYVGKKRAERVKINLIDYDEAKLTEKNLAEVEEALAYKKKKSVTWLNITGVHNTKIVEAVGEKFELHPLILEDITNTTQRPKIDEYDDYLFVVLKMSYFDKETKDIIVEQLSMVINEDYVITFQERAMDILEPLRERIRANKGKIRKLGTDYLAYVIIDSIVDHYFTILEELGEEIENIEEALIIKARPHTLNHIYKLKRELIFLRKSIWPMREVVSNMQRGDYPLIKKTTIIFLRDAYDHTIQVVETIETFRDMVSGLLDLYLSNVSNHMNEIMKVLTIFSTIFIPLTFITGVYGMNFDNMPELRTEYGYFILWGVFVVLTIGMFVYFRKKKWF